MEEMHVRREMLGIFGVGEMLVGRRVRGEPGVGETLAGRKVWGAPGVGEALEEGALKPHEVQILNMGG